MYAEEDGCEASGFACACCVLHNICELKNEEMDPEWEFEHFDDEMVAGNGIRSASLMQARDQIAHYLLHHDRASTSFVHWPTRVQVFFS